MIALECHPGSRSRAVHRIGVEAKRDRAVVRFRYVIEGRIAALRLPPPGLRPIWQHTCCEAFVARPATPAYHEFNFAPSGDWAAYAFSDYRNGGPIDAADPGITSQLFPEALELRASVAVPEGPALLGLSAVIEDRDGRLSYWALRHAPGKPDFHRRDGFALGLA